MRCELTIGDVLDFSQGSVKTGPFGTKLSASEYSDVGVPVISVGEVGYGSISVSERTKRVGPDVTERMPEFLLSPGDIVIGRKGAVDRSAWVKPDEAGYFLGSDGIRLRFGQNVDSRFMAYQLQSARVRNWLLQHAVGTTLASLNEPTLKAVPVHLPSIEVQHAVAAILSALDDKIDSNRRLAALLEETASTLFRARFVDFVGVDELEESEIGLVPRGWLVVSFTDVVDVNPRVPMKKGTVAPYIEMAAVAPWATRPSNVVQRSYSGGSRFEPGDTLMARITGCIEHGKGAFIDFLDVPGTGSTEFLVLRARDPLSPEAVFLLSRVDRVRQHAIASMTGSSGRQRVQVAAFDDLKFAIPSDRESWISESRLFRSCFRASRTLWEESRTLTALRNTLLPKLISGDIRVPDTSDPSELIEPAAEEFAPVP